ncbi:uncharacterized mitochondrial protein-like protein [Tanacetum coccineum]
MAREVELKKQRVFNTVQLIAVRQNVNSVRPNVNTGRANVNSVRQNVNSVKTSVNTGHMTGNKDHLDDFEECKEGSVTFRGSKGYITGKGRIRVGNLDFDSVSFVKELGHFNLFLILQICDKQHRVGSSSGYKGETSGILQNFIRLMKTVYITEKPNVKGVGYKWMFDIDYLTDSMNYILVSLDHQTNPHASTSEVTNSADTLPTPNANASEEENAAEELIVVPTTVKHLLQHKLEHGYIPELTIFNKPQKGIFDEASYDEEGMVYDFNNLPIEVAVSPIPTLRFQMSSMGELIFFLGLQVKQKTDGIFISQDKYVADMLKKFDLASVKTAITPMETKMALTKDEEADEVDVTPMTSHLNAVKRIFKYLKGKLNLGLWYLRESSFDLEVFSDSDYVGANLDRKSTTSGCHISGSRLYFMAMTRNKPSWLPLQLKADM